MKDTLKEKVRNTGTAVQIISETGNEGAGVKADGIITDDAKADTKAALVVTSVASMVDQFLYPSVELLLKLEYKVTVACNYKMGNTCDDETIRKLRQKLKQLGVSCVQIDFDRNITGIRNHIRAYRQIRRVMTVDHYSLIHCHSPIGGLLTRLAIPGKHQGQTVIYTAHGFHFYKEAPLVNWMVFYPIEKFCSKNTDVLITINTEDYEQAKANLCAKRVEYIPGVGIDTVVKRKSDEEIKTFRKRIGCADDETLILSVGELNKNKNHRTVIEALGRFLYNHPEIKWKYYICGKGPLEQKLKEYIELNDLKKRVKVVGFTNETELFLSSANLFIHPSYREGLSVALMEAIAAGVPVICSDIRGNRDLVEKTALFDPGSSRSIEEKLKMFFETDDIQKSAVKNRENLKKCDIKAVMDRLRTIYDHEENIDYG